MLLVIQSCYAQTQMIHHTSSTQSPHTHTVYLILTTSANQYTLTIHDHATAHIMLPEPTLLLFQAQYESWVGHMSPRGTMMRAILTPVHPPARIEGEVAKKIYNLSIMESATLLMHCREVHAYTTRL